MSTIWLDVSTIMKWARPPVGIVRVETEVFKYFAAAKERSVRYCVFDMRAREYRQVEAEAVHEVIRRAQQNRPSVASETPAAQQRDAATAKRVAQKARAVASRLPPLLSRQVQGAGRRSEPALRRLLHEYRLMAKSAKAAGDRLAGRLRALRASRVSSRATAAPQVSHAEPQVSIRTPFSPGDVLLSGGLDWDHKDLSYLYDLKLELNIKVVLWCYDLIPVLYPHLCVSEVAGIFARYFVDLAWCADEVLCISKQSQRDLLSLLKEAGTPEPRTTVVRLGASVLRGHTSAKIEELVIGKYLLFVSTIERRKNHEVIYRAVTRLVEEGYPNPPQVLFVGMPGWGVNDFLTDLRIDPRVRGRFAVLSHVTDEQLACLYENAIFTVYPSLYEGWGLPVAESLAYGKFCLSSNSSSLPEVGGDLVEYLDPWDVGRWAERIAWYLDHPRALAEKEQAIRERYHATTWDETGRAVFNVARRVAADSPALDAAS